MKRTKGIEIFEWIRVVAIALVIALSLRLFVFEIVRVDGPSMQQTLYTNQRVYIEKLFFRLTGPRRGDIVECYFGEDRKRSYIKRVIGMPGEEITISEGRIYINGYDYDDPWFDEMEREDNFLEGTWVVPKNAYFVMGDNRLNSTDSRMDEVGCIKRSNILGKGVFRVWPLDKISTLK